MKAKVMRPWIDENSNIFMRELTGNDAEIILREKAIMAIDGSTTNTGVAIMREADGALIFSISVSSEKDETPVQYKVRLKRYIHNILSSNRVIRRVVYEEPFISGYTAAVKNLLMLRTFIEELVVEYEPGYDYLQHEEINNLKWKKLFLMPSKVPSGTENQKRAVREKLERFMPYISVVSQDEIDAISIGYVAVKCKEEIGKKPKAHPFEYNMQFIGAEDDDGMLMELYDIYTGPKSVLENGIILKEVKGTGDFNKIVYNTMGDDDKLVIIKFKSSKYGNIILEHNLGQMSVMFPYIYAIVTRKNRKR